MVGEEDEEAYFRFDWLSRFINLYGELYGELYGDFRNILSESGSVVSVPVKRMYREWREKAGDIWG